MRTNPWTMAALVAAVIAATAAPATAQLNVTVVGALGDLDSDGDGGAGEAAVLQAVVGCWVARVGTNRNFTLNVFTSALTGGTIGQGRVLTVDGSGIPTSGRITMDNDGSTVYFVDPTPLANLEFTPDPNSQWRFINGPGPVDLFSVVNHEVGHALAWVCGASCGFTNPNYDALFNPAFGSFVSNTACGSPFPLAGQPALPGCVHLQAGGVHPLDVSLRGDGLGGSGSSVVNELSHPGVSGDLMIGFYTNAARELQSVVDVDLLAHAYGDVVNLPPNVSAGANIVSECNATGGSNVSLDGSGSNDAEDLLTYSWTCPGVALSGATTAAPSGFFPVNQTVTCRLDATDLAACPGDADTVNVQVQDTIAPGVNCPAPLSVECSATGGTPATNPAIATFLSGATATDTCDATLSIANNAPGFFPLGGTTVTFSTADDSGNGASCPSTVTVVDTVPPVINGVSASPASLFPPDHRLVPVSVAVSVTDVCDAAASCTIADVTSNEPIDSTGDGTTAPDWTITGPLTLLLRAERNGPGMDRIYTVTIACSDGSTNASTRTVQVRAPHDGR